MKKKKKKRDNKEKPRILESKQFLSAWLSNCVFQLSTIVIVFAKSQEEAQEKKKFKFCFFPFCHSPLPPPKHETSKRQTKKTKRTLSFSEIISSTPTVISFISVYYPSQINYELIIIINKPSVDNPLDIS